MFTIDDLVSKMPNHPYRIVLQNDTVEENAARMTMYTLKMMVLFGLVIILNQKRFILN